MAKSVQFTVSIEGITLSAQQRQRLNVAIQKAALSEFAGIGIRGPVAAHIPRDWIGLVLRRSAPVALRTAGRAATGE
jgi:hypothetical protein